MPAITAVRSTQTRSLSSTPTLRQGARGPAVSQLQSKLKAKGFNVSVDGDFGPKTAAAVRAFQQSRGLSVDGVVGPNTWAKLNAASAPPPSSGATPTLRQGARGAAVSNLQNRLRAHGYNVSVDGDFGPRTAAAVRSFQRAKGLGVDGVVGPNTWARLNGTPGAAPPPATGGARVNGYINGRAVPITVSSVGNGKFLRTDAANAFNRMRADAARAGINLSVVSGFRTMAEQQYLYNLYLQGRGNLAARPGYSNHQSGISADISVPGGYGSSTYRWLQNNARRYGFVNDVAGEPWHWTYRS
ncbi:MAG: peptidoglycan-binding protein [Archangium sp.]|nr:peptidoglycan-binding protein [Archangium sp.]MDP3155085.1 peptidoglycan-binding protein [Archangium sp.]MDP3572063.1 peptidoglycan-binding protein [Archangium sp.]